MWLLRGGARKTMNVYLLEDDGGAIAFDAGEKGMAPAIAAAAERMGGLKRVVLGHGDTDHRGSAPALSKIAPVLCHPDAVEQAQGSGGRDYWDQDKLPAGRPAAARLRAPLRLGRRARPDLGHGGEGESVAGFEVIDFSGHAPGQIGLWRESRPARAGQRHDLPDQHVRAAAPAHIPLDAYNLDSQRASAARDRKLADLEPRIVAPGHLGPLEGPEVAEQLERAATTPAA